MGIGAHIVDAIAREHAFKPISGDVLLIGRQTTYFTPEDLIARLREHGHNPDPSAIDIDKSTINRLSKYSNQTLVTDRSIFHTLGVDKVLALDVSDYEGAEVIHNLNEPLPDHLKGIADFVVDGSTLDNTFNPALTLRNYSELLRPGGRLIAVNSYGVYETAYAIMPPMWYFDYFTENQFTDCKIYISIFNHAWTNVFWVNSDHLRRSRQNMSFLPSPYQNSTIVFAEKGPLSSTMRIPTQQHYRSDADWAQFLTNLSTIQESIRPHIARSYTEQFFNSVDDSYIWIDPDYQPASAKTAPRAQAVAGLGKGFGPNIGASREDFLTRDWHLEGLAVTPAAGTAPDDTNRAFRLEETRVGRHRIETMFRGVTPDATGTLSFYARPAGRHCFRLEMRDQTPGNYGVAGFDLQRKAVVDQRGDVVGAGMEQLRNGWLRCWAAMPFASDTAVFNFTLVDDLGASEYVGAVGLGLLVWGVQFEPGDQPKECNGFT